MENRIIFTPKEIDAIIADYINQKVQQARKPKIDVQGFHSEKDRLEQVKSEIEKIDYSIAGELNDIQDAFCDKCVEVLGYMFENNLQEISIDKFNEICGISSSLVQHEFTKRQFGHFNAGFRPIYTISREDCINAMSFYLYMIGIIDE